MQGVASNRGVVGRGILGTQEHADVFQENTREGRVIQKKQSIIPSLLDLTVAPNMHRRIIRNYAVSKNNSGSIESPCTRKKSPPGVMLPDAYGLFLGKPSDRFRDLVCESMKRLEIEKKGKSDALQLCILVSKEIRRIEPQKTSSVNSGNYYYMQAILGPFYTQNLRPALQILQEKAMAGRSWEYFKELAYLAQCFNGFLMKEFDSRSECKTMIGETYLLFLNNELDYMEHIKDSPLDFSVEKIFSIMDRMLAPASPACFVHFLTQNDIDNIKSRRELLYCVIKENMNKKGVDKKRKELDELQKSMLVGTDDKWAARKFYDALIVRLDGIMGKSMADNITEQQRACLLETLIVLLDKYGESINEFLKLRKDLEMLLITVVKSVLTAIIENIDNVDCWKTKVLELIKRRYDGMWPDYRCEQLYLHCIQSQNVAGAARSKVDLVAYAQCERWTLRIFTQINIESKYDNIDHLLEVAAMLKQLLDKYGGLITDLDQKDPLKEKVKTLEKRLYLVLFSDIFKQYNKAINAKVGFKNIDITMGQYRSRFMKIQPYLFLLNDTARRGIQPVVCCVWSNHLIELSKKKLFRKSDVDSLLCLKEMAPDLALPEKCKFVFYRTQYALLQFLQFMLDHAENTGSAFIEETMELSRWVDHLEVIGEPKEVMLKRNAQWKEKYKRLMSAKAKTSSDTPAGMMPASTHSGIVGVPLEAAGCPLYTGKQTAPRMAPPGIPVPVTQGAFQQPLSVSDFVPVSQSEAAVWSYPELFPKPLSALQEAPVGDPLHLTEHSRVQTCFRQLPTCASVQPQWQMAPPQPSLFRQSTMSPEDKPEYPFVSGIQHMSEPSTESTGAMNLSPPINHEPSSVPIQDKRGQAASRTSIIQERLDTSELCEQSPFDLPSKFETDPALEAMSCRYRPIDYDTPEMDNSGMARGQQCLIHVTARYLQQKKDGLDGLASDTLLPTDIGSDCYPIFMHGIDCLQNWLFQINDELIDRDEIYIPLMGLYNDDGDVMIRDLFNRSLEYQLDRGNFQIASNLLCLRNHLLFIRSLLELKNDNQPAHCPNSTGETRTV